MKATHLFLSLALLVTSLCSFTPESKDNSACYTSFKDAKGLHPTFHQKKVDVARSAQMQDLQGASTEVPATESYDVAYSNKKKQIFVALKMQQAPDQPDQNDKVSIFEYLKNKNRAFAAAESKDLIELDYNGFHFYGLSVNKLSTDTLSLFVCFTEDKNAVYLSFMNATKSFKTIEEFKGLRNAFIGDYTNYLKECTH